MRPPQAVLVADDSAATSAVLLQALALDSLARAAQALVVACLPADLTGAERLDVEICAADGVPFHVVRDAPFDPASGEVLVLCHRHTAVSNPELLFRLKATSVGGRSTVAEHGLVSVID